MRTDLLCLAAVLAAVASPSAGQPAPPKPGASTTATGTFMARSGKPMAGAQIMLADIIGDESFQYSRIRITPIKATTDAQGRFELKGFRPGNYIWVYQPTAVAGVMRADADIKALSAVEKSIVPLLRGYELGKDKPMPERSWGRLFTLLKGHTFLSQGEFMKIWNATARRNPSGPYLEIRKGSIWIERLDDKTQLKLDAWSY